MPVVDQPVGLEPDAQQAWDAFFDMQVEFWRRLGRQLQRDTGLSEPDFAILRALHAVPGGRLRAYELGGVTQFEKSRLHHHLGRMAERDLIVRESTADTPRASVVTLTEAGRDAITRALPVRAAHVRRWLIDPIGEDRLADLADISRVILVNLRAESDDSPGTC